MSKWDTYKQQTGQPIPADFLNWLADTVRGVKAGSSGIAVERRGTQILISVDQASLKAILSGVMSGTVTVSVPNDETHPFYDPATGNFWVGTAVLSVTDGQLSLAEPTWTELELTEIGVIPQS